ncbi:hypothetical protein D3C74_389060 [compost metagenome]
MSQSREDEEKMSTKHQDVQATKTMSNADVMKIAKKGSDKYRKTLDRLSKN